MIFLNYDKSMIKEFYNLSLEDNKIAKKIQY